MTAKEPPCRSGVDSGTPPGFDDADFRPLHCQGCGRFLLYHAIIEGRVAVKCRKCKKWTTLEYEVEESEDDDAGLDSSAPLGIT